jgi:hypothetical protein
LEGIKENSDGQNKLSCDEIKRKLIYDKKNKVYKKTPDNCMTKVQKPKINAHEGKKLYDCKTCNLKFEHRGKLSKHVTDIHKRRKSFDKNELELHKCGYCNYRCYDTDDLVKHIFEAHEEKKEEKTVSNDSGTKPNVNLKKRRSKQQALKIHDRKKLRSNLQHNSGNNEKKYLEKCDLKNVKKTRDGIKDKLRSKQQFSKIHEGKKLRSNLRHNSEIHEHNNLDNRELAKQQGIKSTRRKLNRNCKTSLYLACPAGQ